MKEEYHCRLHRHKKIIQGYYEQFDINKSDKLNKIDDFL